MYSTIKRVIAGACLVAMTACGGGGGVASAVPANAPKTPSGGNVTFVMKIPAKVTTSQSRRHGQYITSNVQGVQIGVAQVPASNNGGFNFYPVGPSQSYCTTAAGGSLTCSLSLQAPAGNDVFTVTTYDQPNYNGWIISTGSVTAQIAGGAANTINVATSGVVFDLFTTVDDPYPATGASLTQAVRATAIDADNNIIVGNFDFPITVSDSDSSGATSLSKTSFAGQSDFSNLTVTYTGASLSTGATFSFSSTSPNTALQSGGLQDGFFQLKPGMPGLTITPSMVIFASPTAASQTVTIGGPSTTAPYSVVSAGGALSVASASPVFTLTPYTPGFTFPQIALPSFRDNSGVNTGNAVVIIQ